MDGSGSMHLAGTPLGCLLSPPLAKAVRGGDLACGESAGAVCCLTQLASACAVCCLTRCIAGCSIPTELVSLVLEEIDETSNLAMLRFLRMFRLLRLLRLLRLEQYIDALEERVKANLSVLRILRMMLKLLFLMHLLGCFWALIGRLGYETNWLAAYATEDGATALTSPAHIQYLIAVYWALTTLTTVGYGDISPTNNTERIYTLFTLLTTAILFGYLASSVGKLMQAVDKQGVYCQEQVDNVKEYMRMRAVPPHLAAKVKSYVHFTYSKRNTFNEEALLAVLTPSLQREMKEFLMKTTIICIPMFTIGLAQLDASYVREFQLELLPKLKTVMTDRNEPLLVKYQQVNTLHLILKGEVNVFSTLDNRRLYPLLAGDVIGEQSVMCGLPSTVSYITTTRVARLEPNTAHASSSRSPLTLSCTAGAEWLV